MVTVGVHSKLEVVRRGCARLLFGRVDMARGLRYPVHAGREGWRNHGWMQGSTWPSHRLCRSGARAGYVRGRGTAWSRRKRRCRHYERDTDAWMVQRGPSESADTAVGRRGMKNGDVCGGVGVGPLGWQAAV